MALNTNKNLKLYYSISEVAKQFNVAESLLRFWEQVFPQLKPHKAGRNICQYSKDDVEMVKNIYNLVKVRGLKLSAARQVLNKNKEGAMNVSDAITKLKEVREKLVTLRSNLSIISPDDDIEV